MKRNTVETLVAFVGLGMVYYGADLKQCLHATGQPAPNCHFDPLGDTFFLVGMAVCLIGIAPWRFYAQKYLCQVCGAEFGGGKEGKLSQTSHLQNYHLDFYRWNVRWSRWTGVIAVIPFVYIIGAGEIVGAVPSFSTFTDWWFLGFLGVIAALVFDLADMHLVTKKFRNKWLLGHPEDKPSKGVHVAREKLSEGVAGWNQLTHGQEQYFGGLMAGGLKRKGNFAGGYGIYFTSRRIIGVKTSRWFVLILIFVTLAGIGGLSALGIVVGISPAYAALIGVPVIGALIALGQRRLRFQDPMTIAELERKKDFEILREDISGIDLTKPGLVKRGHLKVTSNSGKVITLMINQEAGLYERLKGLVSGFSYTPTSADIKGRRLAINYPTPSNQAQEQANDTQNVVSDSKRVFDEGRVEKRDFQWCPHCAAMFPRGTGACPACGKDVSG